MVPYPPPYGSGPESSTPKPPSDAKAVLSLVLGIVSLFVCGLTGIPAIVLGFSAKSDIRASGGMSEGQGYATAGIVTGILGTASGVLGVIAFVVAMFFGLRTVTPATRSTKAHPAPPTAGMHASPAPKGGASFGSIRVIDLDPDAKETFHEQLASEMKRAATAKQSVMVMTSAKWCAVCREFEDALPDPRMQSALANVDIVRVDIDDFDAELKSDGMLENTLPWFYKLDATLRPVDAISAGEWDDNVPENMAPVLKSFLAGTLRTRRTPSPMGTAL